MIQRTKTTNEKMTRTRIAKRNLHQIAKMKTKPRRQTKQIPKRMTTATMPKRRKTQKKTTARKPMTLTID